MTTKQDALGSEYTRTFHTEAAMLQALQTAEQILPSLLISTTGWSGFYAATEEPHLTRMWRQLGEMRLYLHTIAACPRHRAFYHPHPWPSAVRVLDGCYEQGRGFGDPNSEYRPAITKIEYIEAGQAYEMIHPHEWHYVRGVEGPCHTVMITGQPWQVSRRRGNIPSRPLTGEEMERHLAIFRQFYP